MKTIKEYIEFGIDNGFEEGLFNGQFGIGSEYEDNPAEIKFQLIYTESSEWFSLIEIITSKPFIEAITRGWWNKNEYNFNFFEGYKTLEDKITYDQAIAIRDNKLEEFITNLGI